MMLAALVLAGMAGTGAAASGMSNSGGGAWKYQRDISIKENSGTTLTFLSGNMPPPNPP